MISAAATSAADLLWGFSNVGPTTVHLGAPGVDIVSTTRNGGYASSVPACRIQDPPTAKPMSYCSEVEP